MAFHNGPLFTKFLNLFLTFLISPLLTFNNMIQKKTFAFMYNLKFVLYIRNLKYANFTPVFRLHNIYLELSTCPHKFGWILCADKVVFNATTHNTNF